MIRSLISLLGIGLSLICSPAWAATCTLSTSGIAFGGYDPFVSQDLDSVANISVTFIRTRR
jgi:hypothetical protein